MFGTLLISACTLMQIYVFWRAASVQFVVRHVSRRSFIGSGVCLWAVFLLGRVIGHDRSGFLYEMLEIVGMTWLGVLFLLFVCVLAVDLITGFGFFMPRLSSSLRGWALLVGSVLCVVAIFQASRVPIIQKHEVNLPGLPKALDGTVLVAVSDLHLGSASNAGWLKSRIVQINAEKPDLVVLLGDVIEGHTAPPRELVAAFRDLSAPLGVWFVLGNHEFHGSGEMGLFEEMNFKSLRNRWAEPKPGLVIAGVDDLTNRYRNGEGGDVIAQAVAGRPSGATILLSHTPWKAEEASKAGVGLMLSGHTHGGQIWPFCYLVRTRYPLLEGRYQVKGTTVIVCRGTGSWGPRMRLWHPSEILKVTLRAVEG